MYTQYFINSLLSCQRVALFLPLSLLLRLAKDCAGAGQVQSKARARTRLGSRASAKAEARQR